MQSLMNEKIKISEMSSRHVFMYQVAVLAVREV
jgi:hypothetical protein